MREDFSLGDGDSRRFRRASFLRASRSFLVSLFYYLCRILRFFGMATMGRIGRMASAVRLALLVPGRSDEFPDRDCVHALSQAAPALSFRRL